MVAFVNKYKGTDVKPQGTNKQQFTLQFFEQDSASLFIKAFAYSVTNA